MSRVEIAERFLAALELTKRLSNIPTSGVYPRDLQLLDNDLRKRFEEAALHWNLMVNARAEDVKTDWQDPDWGDVVDLVHGVLNDQLAAYARVLGETGLFKDLRNRAFNLDTWFETNATAGVA